MTRPQLAAVATVVCLLALAGSAGGHIIHGRPTLLSLVGSSELIAHVRVLDPRASVTLESTGERRPVVRVELLEVIKGTGEPGELLLFASHGHGVAQYAKGEEALLFLEPIERTSELAALRASGLRWVSLQEQDARYVLIPESRDRVLAATRRYAAAGHLESSARIEAVRSVTVDMLTSGDARLAAAAVQDLVAAQDLPLVVADDVPRLREGVIDNPDAPIGVRIGLLTELDRRGLVAAVPIWQALLVSTPEPDLLQVVRAAGRHPSLAMDATLIEMLGGSDALAAAAALALGDPAHADAVPALAGALERDDPRVRMAAIRSLGRVGTPAAQAALEAAAADHEDVATRRRAAAEVKKRELRQAR